MRELSIYLHIPFCVRKCLYCDFLSFPVGAGADDKRIESYVNLLKEEIIKEAPKYRAHQVISVFWGGGTPSLVAAKAVSEIMETLRRYYRLAADAEITIEVNPGTVTADKLQAYITAGMNRLSIGLQSADGKELEGLGRIHTYADFLDTYHMAREEGFSNINVDLISAIPFQTLQSWERTLRRVAELGTEHISAYSLIIEEGTPFYERYRQHPDAAGRCLAELPDEEEERRMYYETETILEEYGYRRYEISNYAREGFQCRHNLGYWERAEYLGIGVGAASLMGNMRWIEGEAPEALSEKDCMEEYMFLGLRKMAGVSKNAFAEMSGQSMEDVYGAVIEDMKEKGLLLEEGDSIRLTKRGIDVSSYVMCRFLLDEEE